MATATQAANESGSATPNLTKGGELIRQDAEEGWRARWVGPLGIYCGLWRPDASYLDQLLVQSVDAGSPADGVLRVGDMIIGADGTGAEKVPPFQPADWALIPIADAIAEAEARDPALLKLLIWRPADKGKGGPDEPPKLPSWDDFDPGANALDSIGSGDLDGLDGLDDLDDLDLSPKEGTEEEKKAAEDEKTAGSMMTVTIKLESLGRYSDTAPYDCEKSKRILRKGIKAMYDKNKPGIAGFQALCLLAADAPSVPDNDKYQARAKEWVYDLKSGGSPWFSGAKLIVLSEYYMKTKDKGILPKLVAQAEHHAKGVSWFGTSGHRWAELKPDLSYGGRIAGYGPINCSGALGFLGLSLAHKAGADSPAVQVALRSQTAFFGHYALKSGMGYGEHAYSLDGGLGDTNGKGAMSGIALGLQDGKEEKAKFFCAKATTSSLGSREYAHGGSYFGQVMHPIGAAQGGMKAANFMFREIRTHLDLKRRWDHGRIYDSTGNGYTDFGAEAAALIFYAMPLKQLYLTGRGQKDSLKFTEEEFNKLVADKQYDVEKSTTLELIEALSVMRRRGKAARQLADRMKATPDSAEWPGVIDQIVALATNPGARPEARAAACKALQLIKDRNKTTTATLKNVEIAKAMVGMLKDSNAYVRFGGVRVLQKLRAEDVRPYAHEIMDAAVAAGRSTFPLDPEDPVQWSHGQMGVLLYNKVLSQGLEGVDRKKLIPALRSLLDTPDGGARNVIVQGLDNLTIEETLGLADVIVDTVKYPAPANSMFDGAAEKAQNALAKYHFEEALPLSAAYNPSSLASTGLLGKYGPSALETQSARELMKAIGDLMLVQAVGGADQLVDQMINGTSPKKLNKLKSIESIQAAESTLTLPAAKTELTVNATNHLVREAKGTRYTWRKVFGAGKVVFSANASVDSKSTTVSFTDQKPGTYRFEVRMSDDMSFNEVTRTVDVTLHDKQGKLPRNRPPQAKSQSLTVVPGVPIEVALSGTDPDGDDLGFVVTRQPAHGMLSGVGGKLTYVANYGNPQGQSAAKKAKDKPAPPTAPSLDNFDLLDEPVVRPKKKTAARKGRGGGSWTDSITFEAIDGQGQRATGTIDFAISDKGVGVVVYEGFDYPMGTIIGQSQTNSFGFDAPWQKSDGRGGGKGFWVERASLDDPDKPESLSFPGLPRTGGKYVHGENHRHCSRPLDPRSLSAHGLLDNGGELWFSLFVTDPGGQGSRLTFGLSRSRGEPDVGFVIDGKMNEIDAIITGATSATRRSHWSRHSDLRLSEKGPNMVIGRCIWGKTDKDPDTVEIYRVFDAPRFGPLLVDDPAAVAKGIVSQQELMRIHLDAGVGVDEIRIGPTLNSVMLGTKPLAANTVSQQ